LKTSSAIFVLPERRYVNVAGALACIAALAFALYAQHGLHLEPCPLCIFQRITMAALGMTFIAAAIHNAKGWGARVYATLIGITSLATIGVAGRHVYIQSLPPGSVPSCGAPLEVMMRFSPLTDVVRKVLTGGGECSVINWRFLGLSMPWWVLFLAVVLGAVGVWANLRRR
jgi:disulfide bond formation protein DsbB